MSNRTEKGGPPSRKRGGLRLSKAEKIAIPVIIIVAIWIAYSVMQPSITPPGQTTTTSVTSQSGGAPDFTLPVVGPNGLTGQSVSLSSYRGKVVFLEFMEPWCPHCQNMAPVLADLYSNYGKNVVFISVSGPWQGASAADTAKFIKDYGTSWVYVYDSSGTIMSSYGVNSTPTFFIIGKDGSVLATYQGEQPYNSLAADLNKFTS